MTQARLPLFTTGVPQIVPSLTTLDVLDLRGERTNQQTRLLSLWLHYSSRNMQDVEQAVSVFVQAGDDSPILLTKATINQLAGPVKVLTDYALRGPVRVLLSAEDCDLDNGEFAVAFGYYTIEGSAPRTSFEVRPLQPDPNVVDTIMGRPIVQISVALADVEVHQVSDTNIDEVTVLQIANVPSVTDSFLYFEGTTIEAPYALGDGFVSLPPRTSLATSFSSTYRVFDGIPFRGAGLLSARSTVTSVAGYFNRD